MAIDKKNINSSNEGKGSLSRRNFLKGAAASAVGVATMGVLGACTNAATPTDTTPPVAPSISYEGDISNYEVINSDLIIIGAGFGAMSAAFQAIEKGINVTIIEKGPYRHGGGAGFNWDAIATWQVPDGYSTQNYLQMVVNQEAYKKSAMTEPHQNTALRLVNTGQVLPDRNEDGSVHYYIDFPTTKGVEGVFPRNSLDELAKHPNVNIVDRTMVTDILINDGVCLGAMGIYLPTGDFRVYRAPATILATGGTCWIYGWNTVSANSINSADNTGDVDMALFRHGVGIGDSEYACYDFASTYPEGLACGWGTMLNPDANEWVTMCDRDGNRLITEESGIDVVRGSYDRPYFNQQIAKLMLAGKGTDEGGILVDISGVTIRPAIQKNLKVFEKFGIDPYKELIPAREEMYEHGGTPVIDENMMSEIKGLFCSRGAGTYGALGGGNLHLGYRFGSYAARCAIEYMNNTAAPSEIDWTPAEKEYLRLQEILSRNVEGGLRPHVVRQNIQKTCHTCLGIIREKDKLEAAVIELERIRREDLPKMYVTDKSKTFNTEWKEAVEAYNLLDIAELSVKATLLREETRGQYMRSDFPEKDDKNWNVMLVGKLKDDKLTFEKKEMPTVTW
jgi:succinate dehydrogenase/fumarate reductase flavoprotein subunit